MHEHAHEIVALGEPVYWMGFAAAALLALMAAPLGCFVVWRRLSYFGDALAHSGLLGVALGLLFGLSQTASTFALSGLFALLLLQLMRRGAPLGHDTLLGLLAHSGLAIGVIALALMGQNQPEHLHGLLFGELFLLEPAVLAMLAGGALLVGGLLWYHWQGLVLLCLQEDLARAEGVNRFRMQCLVLLLVTLVVAMGMKLVGILLVTSFLIIPAATARQCARSPRQMALLAMVFAQSAALGGLSLAVWCDLPAGAMMVSAAALQFVVVMAASGASRSGA